MELQAPVRYVWRFILRRVWQRSSRGDMRHVWRKVWRRVPRTPGHASTLPSGWDTQSITYGDCEAFFRVASKGSIKKLDGMLYDTYGPNVTAELAKCYNEDGETPLLVAIRQGNLRVVKYLILKLKAPLSQHGQLVWKGVEYSEVPPLFAAILFGQKNIVKFLIAAEIHFGQTDTSINSIISSSNSQQQKINTLELLGATHLCFDQLRGAREAGLLCWQEATILRNSTANGWQAIPKRRVIAETEFARKAVGFTSEFTTQEELDQMDASDLQLYTQSILVSQRILLTIFGTGVDFFNGAHLCRYIDMCHTERQHSRVICSAILFFDYYQHQVENLDYIFACRVLCRMTQSFKQLLRHSPLDNDQELSLNSLMKAFEFASCCATRLNNEERSCRYGTWYDLATNILEIAFLIAELFPHVNAAERLFAQFKRDLYRVIRMDHRFGYNDQNLLHMICRSRQPLRFGRPVNWDDEIDGDEDNGSTSSGSDDEDEDTDGYSSGYSSCDDHPDQYDPDDVDNDGRELDRILMNSEPQVETANLMEIPSVVVQTTVLRWFLELGADPNATDLMRSTPLLLLARYSKDFGPAQLVIEHGGHVDQVNLEGRSPLTYFKEQLAVTAEMADPCLRALVRSALPLRCLAARALRKSRLPFLCEIPATLYSFVKFH